MKAKTAIIGALTAGIFTGVGIALDKALLSVDTGGAGAELASADARALADEVQGLRRQLSELEARNKDLEAELALAGKRPGKRPQGGAALPNAKLPEAGAAASDGDLAARVAELEHELAKARGEVPLTDEELAAKVGELSADFERAFASKDPKSAMAAMKALSDLDERAYPDLLKMWARMDGEEWFGLGWQERRGWVSNPGVFHWALSQGELPLDDKEAAANLQRQSIFALRFMEGDDAKRAESYVSFLSRMEAPGPLPEGAQAGGRGRGFGFGQDTDSFRMTLGMLARSPTPESAEYLSGLATNPEMPADVRKTAVEGLVGQDTPEARRALQDALYDSDPEVKRAAELAQAQSQVKATGLFVTSVRGEAARVGIPVGSVVTSFGGQPVRNGFDLRRIRGSLSGETAVVQANINGAARSFTVNLSDDIGISGNSVTAGE